MPNGKEPMDTLVEGMARGSLRILDLHQTVDRLQHDNMLEAIIYLQPCARELNAVFQRFRSRLGMRVKVVDLLVEQRLALRRITDSDE